MKKILIYNYDEPLAEQGGIERVTDLLSTKLQKAGYIIYILCTKRNRLNKKYNAPVPIYYIPDTNPQKFIIKCITELEIEIIIDQTEGGIVGPYGYFKYKPKEFEHIKLIAVQHSSRRAVLSNTLIIFGKSGSNAFYRCLAGIYNNTFLKLRYLYFLHISRIVHKNLAINYDVIVTLSKSFIEDFIYYYPKVQKKKLIAIPNPNTYECAHPSTLDKRVLFVGRLRINPKGVDKLLHIWSRLESIFPNWALDIVGDGEDRVGLLKLSEELKLKNVIFHGFQDPAQFYRRASIFCITSLYEGFPMVLNEAMAHGVVPVVFDTFGTSQDIIDDGVCGFLIEPYNIDEYSQKLSMLMSSRDLLSNMSKNAIAHSELFSCNKIIDKWITLLNSFDSTQIQIS